MGPKKKGGGKGKAAAKKAAELAEQARLEEERVQKEIEDRRIQVEQEALRQIAADEKRERLAAKCKEDAARLKEQQSADARSLSERQRKIAEWQHAQRERSEWERILRCDVLPDAANEPDLNAYLGQWRDGQHEGQDVLADADAGEVLLGQIDVLFAQHRSLQMLDKARWCLSKAAEVLDVIHSKLDRWTASQLVKADVNGAVMQSSVLMQSDGPRSKYALWTTGHVKLKRTKVIEFADIGVLVDPPNVLTMQNNNGMGLRVLYSAHDPFEQMNKSRLGSYGGVYRVDALELPLPSSIMHDWVVRELNETFESVHIRPYPGFAASENGAAIQPIKLSWTVGKQIMVDEMPTVGWWDHDKSIWSTDGISEVKFSTEDRVLTLQSLQVRSLSLVHSKTMDAPYKSWSVRLVGPNHGRVCVEGSRLVIEIELKDDRCSLIRPQAPELAHLHKGSLLPAAFLTDLSRCGVCIMPTDDALGKDAKIKTNSVESFAYGQMALVSGAYEIQMSEWNSRLDQNHVAFNVKIDLNEQMELLENLAREEQEQNRQDAAAENPDRLEDPGSDEFGEKLEDEEKSVQPKATFQWITIGSDSDRVYVCNQEQFNSTNEWDYDDPEMPGEVSHSSLHRVLTESRMTTEQRARLDQTSVVYQESLRQVLSLLRVLSI